jgi:hypothetical protein
MSKVMSAEQIAASPKSTGARTAQGRTSARNKKNGKSNPSFIPASNVLD